MDRLTEGLSGGLPRLSTAGVFPLINLTEDADRFYLRAELPGIKPDDLEISATANSIALSGERRIVPENEGARYHRREREAGKFNRVINLPDQVDSDKIEAECRNGVLTVAIPKSQKSKPRQISIKAS
jgi:HSP20 family protein